MITGDWTGKLTVEVIKQNQKDRIELTIIKKREHLDSSSIHLLSQLAWFEGGTKL